MNQLNNTFPVSYRHIQFTDKARMNEMIEHHCNSYMIFNDYKKKRIVLDLEQKYEGFETALYNIHNSNSMRVIRATYRFCSEIDVAVHIKTVLQQYAAVDTSFSDISIITTSCSQMVLLAPKSIHSFAVLNYIYTMSQAGTKIPECVQEMIKKMFPTMEDNFSAI